MHVLFLNYEYPPLGGGGGVVMAALARELARRHQVTVLTSRAMDLEPESLEGGVRVIRVPVFLRKEAAVANFPSMLSYLPAAALRGVTLGRRGRIDVINTHFVVPTGPVGDLLARLLKVPNVLSVHGGDLYDPSKKSSPHRHRWLRGPIRALLRRADILVGQSRNTLQHVSQFYGVDRETSLIPLGIERPALAGVRSRSRFNLPEDAFVMATVGRVVARKATLQLVQALRDTARSNFHLLIVGDGPDVGKVRAAAAEANLLGQVHILGQVTEREKFEALEAADIFVSTSQHEGFGLVFLEAMACALPIICYDHGGQTDFLTDGETGYVVPLNDLGRIVSGMVSLHDQVQERRRMAQRNSELINDYFIDTCAIRYEQQFEAAMRAFSQRNQGVR